MSTIPPEPSPISHEAAASSLMKEIRELIQTRIPGFALAAKGRRLQINTTASLSDAFLESVAAACEAHPELAAVGQITAAEIRDCISYSGVYGSLAEGLRILSRGVDDTVAERRNEVGKKVRRIYHHAITLNKEEGSELLVPHLAAMKRTMNRGRTSTSVKRAAAAKAAATAAAASAGSAVAVLPAPIVPAPTAPIAPAVTPKKEGSSS